MKIRIEKISYKEFKQSEKNQIDLFIDNNNGLVFHETTFNEILSDFIESQLYYHIAFVKNNIVGICPVHKKKNGLIVNYYSGKLDHEIPYGGWVYSNDVSLNKLRKSFKPGFFEGYYYFSSIVLHDKLDIEDKKLFPYWTSTIELKDTDVWVDCINSKRRNMIRKAQKNKVEIVFSGVDSINDFYGLLLAMNAKTGMKSKDLDFYKQLLLRYPNEKAKLLLAYHDKNLLSGLFLIGNKNFMHYWQGATAVNAGNLGQGELLQWEAIKWSSKIGIKYYDLCYLYSKKQLEENEPKQMAIAKFKLGFSKDLASFYATNYKSISYKIISKIKKLV